MTKLFSISVLGLALLVPMAVGAHERQTSRIEQNSMPAVNLHPAYNSHAAMPDGDDAPAMQWRRLPASHLARLHINARNIIKT